MAPDGWRQTRLGNLFRSRKEKGVAGLPTLSVTLNDGLVLRNSLARKTHTTLAPEEHLLVRKGDIAYNMMRMWQGASGLAQFDALVSPAYVVLESREGIDPLFASYFFKSARMVYLFWAYSYGLTKDRLRLYFRDFSLIQVAVPPMKEQHRIAEVFSALDRSMNALENLMQNTHSRNRALTVNLLTRKVCFPGFSGSIWRSHQIGELGTTYGGLSGKTQGDFGEGVPYIPYLNIFCNSRIDLSRLDRVRVLPGETQNRVRYGDAFFTTSSEVPEEVGMSSVLLDHVTELYLNSFSFGFRLHSFDLLRPEFARFLFRSPEIRQRIGHLAQGATRHNLPKNKFLKLPVSLPPIKEQITLADCLACADDDIRKERMELKTLHQQKRALLQQLFRNNSRLDSDNPDKPIISHEKR